MAWIYILAAIFIGVIFSLQPVINAAVACTIGTPLSAGVLSVSITLTCQFILSQIQGGGNLRPSNIVTLPWWLFLVGGSVYLRWQILQLLRR
ncbi:MAG: DMT family transporter [Rhizobiaceae bacterium]|nr:DMT family transporter [Rhizobiaceae bacterium]